MNFVPLKLCDLYWGATVSLEGECISFSYVILNLTNNLYNKHRLCGLFIQKQYVERYQLYHLEFMFRVNFVYINPQCIKGFAIRIHEAIIVSQHLNYLPRSCLEFNVSFLFTYHNRTAPITLKILSIAIYFIILRERLWYKESTSYFLLFIHVDWLIVLLRTF